MIDQAFQWTSKNEIVLLSNGNQNALLYEYTIF